MNTIAAELQSRIDEYLPQLRSLNENDINNKISPEKWSKKEIVGHLIDSAENNIRRFVIAQYEDSPTVLYDQDKWVSLINYQQMESADVIQLWYLLNKQIISILNNLSDASLQRICQKDQPRTIKWLAEDYIKHLRHHIHIALDLEKVDYP